VRPRIDDDVVAKADDYADANPALLQSRPAIEAFWYDHGHIGSRVR
jgi:hypothetical protein